MNRDTFLKICMVLQTLVSRTPIFAHRSNICCPRDWRLSASYEPKIGVTPKATEYHGSMVTMGSGEPPICRYAYAYEGEYGGF